MRSLILAVLLVCVGVSTAGAQAKGYCRIYRCMTIGTSACYYCLPNDTCNGAVGYMGGWNESTGPCVACETAPSHCICGQAAPSIRPPAAPPREGEAAPPPPADVAPELPNAGNAAPPVAMTIETIEALTTEPEILWNPDFTGDVKKWKLTIDLPGEPGVKALLVTATVKPRKNKGSGPAEHYETAYLGFAVRYAGDLSAYPAVTAANVAEHGNGHKFKFKEADGTTHNKKCVIGPPVAID